MLNSNMQCSTPLRSLEARYYVESSIFDAELNGMMARTWQFAGHITQVPNVGDYFTFTLAGQSLFCIRGKDGEVRGFYNVCQHRAHELVSGEGRAKLLVCPYHSWTYELDGALRSGPNIRAVRGFDRGSICLTQVRVENFNGFLFANLDADAPSMDELFPNVRGQLRDYVPHIDDLVPVKWVEVPENCNWKVSVENYSECYHCSKNHVSFSSGIIKPESYNILPQGYCLRHTSECQNLEDMSYPLDMSVPHASDYSSWFLWPMFSFQVYPGNVLNTYHWRPTSANSVTLWRGWYTVGGEDSEVISGLADLDRNTTVAEDIRLVESVQRGLLSKGYRPGPLVIDPDEGVMSEHSIGVLQQWMREAVSDAK